jgi:hypothetical protein
MWDLWWTKWHWAGFLRVLRFPLPVLIPPTASHVVVVVVIIIIIIIIIINHPGAATTGETVPTYQVDSVSPHSNKLKKMPSL